MKNEHKKKNVSTAVLAPPEGATEKAHRTGCCAGAIPVSFQDWRLDVVLAAQLWGSWRLLRRGWVGRVSDFQS